MLRGTSGLLRPEGRGVRAVYNVDGFTTFNLRRRRNTITLVAYQVDFVSITNFQLRATELGPNGASFSVQVQFYTGLQVVSSQIIISYLILKKKNPCGTTLGQSFINL